MIELSGDGNDHSWLEASYGAHMESSMRRTAFIGLILMSSCLPAASKPIPGPDKQSIGTWYGAMVGAGSGAVTGAQLGSGTGPGAWVGAGFGAVYGMFSGLGLDALEEDQLKREDEESYLREVSWVQELLSEHYARRLELHPNRDIFPADWFFEKDSVEVKGDAAALVRELSYLTRRRMPWSRVVIASYVTANEPNSSYAAYLTERRAQNLATEFIRNGMEARRVFTQPLVLPDPILVDPDDSPNRYRQAIEIVALDK